ILGIPIPGEVEPKDERIVGGKSLSIKQVPFIISLQNLGMHMCGGSIINENTIITAAHCTNGKQPIQLEVRAGSTIREKGGQVLQVETIHQNPEFNLNTIDYDVTILKLKSNLNFSENVKPIDLADANQVFENGKQAMIFGWGTKNYGSSRLPSELQSGVIQIVDRKICRKRYSKDQITDRMLCAGIEQGGIDACQGDSGGPLVIDNVLAGITSWGSACGKPHIPGVYSNVAGLRKYIDKFL
ncbi:unnamed protein product, partial [Tenebrio molitor]